MKVVRLVFGIFLLVGLGLIAGGVYAIEHTRQFLSIATETRGVVTQNIWCGDMTSSRSSRVFYPRIRFQTADGQQISFVSDTGADPPAHRENDSVAVLYDPRQPHHAYLKGFASLWLTPALLIGLGTFFSTPALVLLVWKKRTDEKNEWLRRNGRRIQAEVACVELNQSLTINGTNPFRIRCQWLDPAANEMHIFYSANLWFDPTNYIPGKTIEVLIDPNNPHRYLVETSFLPKVV